jgi:hypothetical protein
MLFSGTSTCTGKLTVWKCSIARREQTGASSARLLLTPFMQDATIDFAHGVAYKATGPPPRRAAEGGS